MGEAKKRPLRLHFDRRLKLEFHGARVSSDAECLRVDPVVRHVIGRKAPDHPAASRHPELGTRKYRPSRPIQTPSSKLRHVV